MRRRGHRPADNIPCTSVLDSAKLAELPKQRRKWQLLPDGAVKGGSAIKLRFGESATRFTTDLDVARASTLDEFISELESRINDDSLYANDTLASLLMI